MISTRWFTVLALGLGLGGPAPGTQEDRLPTQARPNVLVVVADDIGWRDVWPRVPTPNIAMLSRFGMRYRNAYSMPSCSPTRHTAMFGRYGRRDGVLDVIDSYAPPGPDNPAPDPSLLSLPAMFKARGYATGAFGKWHLGANSLGKFEVTPHLYGFDVFRAGSMGNLNHEGVGYYDWLRVDDGESALTSEYATLAVRDAFTAWWQETSTPKFAWVSFQAAHLPLHVPPAELLPPSYPTPETRREKFEAAVVAMDTALGQMLSVVSLHDTLVLFFGDNGTPSPAAAADQDRRKLKFTTFEGGVNVPLIAAGPGVKRGRECDALVHTVDVMATLAEHLDFELPDNMAQDSVSFARSFQRPMFRSPRPWVYFERVNPPQFDRAIRDQRYKLRVGHTGTQLYDLLKDPQEVRPLPLGDPANAAIRARLQATMDSIF